MVRLSRFSLYALSKDFTLSRVFLVQKNTSMERLVETYIHVECTVLHSVAQGNR